LRLLADSSFPSLFPADVALFLEGQIPRGLFVLCRGRVKLSMVSAEGKTLILRLSEAGSVLGVSACVLNEPYMMTVETITACQVNFIRREDFARILEKDSEIALRVTHWLSQEYQSACRGLGSFGLGHSASAKVARFLLDWNRNWVSNGRGQSVKLALTHEEMAQMIGISRETVTRMLARFRDRQFIEIRGATLTILDSTGLEEMAADHADRERLGSTRSSSLIASPLVPRVMVDNICVPTKGPTSAAKPMAERLAAGSSKLQRLTGS
jgi:CRP/FNR family transcriptional regulator, cyclic AMP receptor protein